MSHVLKKNVGDVATSGPGLAFIVFPECIAQMPISPFWSICFFFMLLTLGLDTQFAMFEAVVTGLVDEYPLFRKKKELFIAFLCFLCFLLGIPMVTQVSAESNFKSAVIIQSSVYLDFGALFREGFLFDRNFKFTCH